MKRFLTILFCLPLFALAQKTEYTTHTVGPKESLTSIGRMYNINGRELANLNNIEYEKGLSLGQVLKVPKVSGVKATPAPVVKAEPVVVKKEEPVKTVVKTNENGTPIYHTVAPKETLYGISVKYGKVPIADIKRWNNITTDGLSEGATIIVGYTNTPNNSVKATPPKPAPVVVKETPAPVQETKPTPVVVKKEEPIVTKTVASENTGRNFSGGSFKSVYNTQTKNKNATNENGIVGVFKSTSGWEDGKYYCLHNTAVQGTIVKVTNPATGKTIYAKVLDVIPDIKQNTGLVMRLSNAAADELGIGDSKFEGTLSYSK
ncbi:MAG: LysM peptidoglycan-binding domain-containing protein [Bacteroidota bacterium]